MFLMDGNHKITLVHTRTTTYCELQQDASIYITVQQQRIQLLFDDTCTAETASAPLL